MTVTITALGLRPQALSNRVNFLSFTAFFLLLVVFIPVSLMSERLSEASESLREAAFDAAADLPHGDVDSESKPRNCNGEHVRATVIFSES